MLTSKNQLPYNFSTFQQPTNFLQNFQKNINFNSQENLNSQEIEDSEEVLNYVHVDVPKKDPEIHFLFPNIQRDFKREVGEFSYGKFSLPKGHFSTQSFCK